METLKEIAIDVLIIISVWLLVTAEGVATQAKGLSCGQEAQVRVEARAATPEEAVP